MLGEFIGSLPTGSADCHSPVGSAAQAFAIDSSDTRYLNSAQLKQIGSIAARPTFVDFKSAKWDEVLDGIVVFREDRPPKFSNP